MTDEVFRVAQGIAGPPFFGNLKYQANCTPASGQPTIRYEATGTTNEGPYPGTFRETGVATLQHVTPQTIGAKVVAFEATFTIESTLGRITGTKELDVSEPGAGLCLTDTSLGFPVVVVDFAPTFAFYSAVIETSTERCNTEGRALVQLSVQDTPGHPQQDGRGFTQHFQTGSEPVCTPLHPTSKSQCKKGGWKVFTGPKFKNQGQCVAYVNHHDGRGADDDH